MTKIYLLMLPSANYHIHVTMQASLLQQVTLAELNYVLDAGNFTSVDLVKAYLARISEVDGIFRSILEVNGEAESIAMDLDEESLSWKGVNMGRERG